MKEIKWSYLILAVIAALSTASFGIAVAEKSLLIAICCALGLGLSYAAARRLRAGSSR
ncbi:DUF5325 family protein [Salibacterium halotolerans]|uniref:Uncharacterized protein n=1 Tax=Salibacterium halotolerans TaxID=1884432 RepID=A0A1I5LZY7_9BACI|nr:DUF5325 family protein [Salibacterium halotolerans]SFP02717.1 hypothetical protein SAMN05518683_10235 [Salibacterium halotolerans]